MIPNPLIESFILNFSKWATNDENKETKKCKDCLKRIKASYIICPYCGSKDFVCDT
jgi:DNA-directed RNA polymerase subunit RPC12/RpoP